MRKMHEAKHATVGAAGVMREKLGSGTQAMLSGVPQNAKESAWECVARGVCVTFCSVGRSHANDREEKKHSSGVATEVRRCGRGESLSPAEMYSASRAGPKSGDSTRSSRMR